MKYRYIIWDLDGTICDTRDAIFFSIREALNVNQYSEVPDSMILRLMEKSPKLEQAFSELILSHDIQKLNKLCTDYREIYSNQAGDKEKLFEGIKETISKSNDNDQIQIVISNKFENLVQNTLKRFNIFSFFDFIYGVSLNNYSKPDKNILDLYILNKYINSSRKEYLMIGDTISDILFAKNCRIDSCFVTYGLGNKTECISLKPEYIVDSTSSLDSILST